jgi:hypothetical protein
MKNTNDFLIAHIDVEKTQFSLGENLGIEFKNEIDAWAKMEAHFRHQIRNPRKRIPKRKHDLIATIYSIRHKLEL